MNDRWMSVILIIIVTIVLIVIIGLILWSHPSHENEMTGGSREVIFSRFSYQPDFPNISQFDTIDLDRFSKVYNTPGPLKIISGRPYRFYHTKDSTWLDPWDFPQMVINTCLQKAMRQCQEPIVTLKSEEDKLSGLEAETPPDMVHVSPCFDAVYEACGKIGEKSLLATEPSPHSPPPPAENNKLEVSLNCPPWCQ